MANFLDKDQNLLTLHSEFVGDSWVRVRVRNYGKDSNKILVDVTEYTCHRTSMARALRIARQEARKVNVSSMDCSLIRDDEIDRKATKPDGTKVAIHIRQTCFAF